MSEINHSCGNTMDRAATTGTADEADVVGFGGISGGVLRGVAGVPTFSGGQILPPVPLPRPALMTGEEIPQQVVQPFSSRPSSTGEF